MKPFVTMMILILGFQMTVKAQKSPSNHLAPKEDIRVNREFDENGNLVKFDSLYSYSWSGDSLLVDSIHPGNFSHLFGNDFNFLSEKSFFDPSFFEDFDQHFFAPLSKQQDSIMNQFHLHHKFHFNNDSTQMNALDLDDFFKQFSDNMNDSSKTSPPFSNQFNFFPGSMNEIMEMLEQKMKELEELHQKNFNP